MAFTKGLYYPHIQVKDEAWLKNAMLYWDSIETIVPESLEVPYRSDTLREFQDAGMLIPRRVSSDMNLIRNLADDVITYLDSTEAISVLVDSEAQTNNNQIDMPSHKILRNTAFMYPDKLANEIRYELENRFGRDEDESIVRVDRAFANYYMSLLAARLADEIGASLLTDSGVAHNLTNLARMDASLGSPPEPRHMTRSLQNDAPKNWAYGALVDLLFKTCKISPSTSVEKILKFKEKRRDELNKFKLKIDELSRRVNTEESIHEKRNKLASIYDEVNQTVDDIHKCLDDELIRTVIEDTLKVCFLSIGANSISTGLLGIAGPYALLAGAGITIIASPFLYNIKKRKLLRENPYSYLYLAEDQFI